MLEPANGCEAEHNHDSHTKTKGPEVLRNKVQTGWGLANFALEKSENFSSQKIHHKSALQISRPKTMSFSDKVHTVSNR